MEMRTFYAHARLGRGDGQRPFFKLFEVEVNAQLEWDEQQNLLRIAADNYFADLPPQIRSADLEFYVEGSEYHVSNFERRDWRVSQDPVAAKSKSPGDDEPTPVTVVAVAETAVRQFVDIMERLETEAEAEAAAEREQQRVAYEAGVRARATQTGDAAVSPTNWTEPVE